MSFQFKCPSCSQEFKGATAYKNQSCPYCHVNLNLIASSSEKVPLQEEQESIEISNWVFAIIGLGLSVFTAIAFLIYRDLSSGNNAKTSVEKVSTTQPINKPASIKENTVQPRIEEEQLANADRSTFYNPKRNPPYLANETTGAQSREEAIAKLARQFSMSVEKIKANMGDSNSLNQIHINLVRAKLPEPPLRFSNDKINYQIVKTLKDSWVAEGWRYKSSHEQKKAIALMILVVRTDIQDPEEEEATLDHIQRTISSW